MARLFWFALVTTVASQGPCTTDDTVRGYSTIVAINNAMSLLLNSIQSGGQPSPPYLFTICPKTIVSVDQTALTPVLSGAEFTCGANGALDDSCVIQGGENQVVIENSKVEGYVLRNLTFQGITFSGSTQSSILAGAGSGTTASFIDCKWIGFAGNAAINMFQALGKALRVVVTRGSAENGAALTIVSNNNGTLIVDGLTVTGSNGQGGILTSGSGNTTLRNSTFSSNNFFNVISTDMGSSLQADRVSVTSNGANLQQVFYAQGTGAKMNLTNIIIRDNDLGVTFWDGITFAQGASGRVAKSTIENNVGLEFGINVRIGSTATVEDTEFIDNTAATGGLSSVLYALNNSKLYLRDVNVTGNSGFIVYGFTGFQSFTEYVNTTFVGGTNVTIAVFIDQDSTFTKRNLFYFDVVSNACPPPNQREFIENVGSHCFYRGPGDCAGVCGVVRNNTFAPTPIGALPTVVPTPVPTNPTTSPPSTSPIAQPLSTTPTSEPSSTQSSAAPATPSVSPTTAAPATSSVSPTTAAPATPSASPTTAAPATPSVSPTNELPVSSASVAPTGTSTPVPIVTLSPTFLQSGVISFSPTGVSGKSQKKKNKDKKTNPNKKQKKSGGAKSEKSTTGKKKSKSAPKSDKMVKEPYPTLYITSSPTTTPIRSSPSPTSSASWTVIITSTPPFVSSSSDASIAPSTEPNGSGGAPPAPSTAPAAQASPATPSTTSSDAPSLSPSSRTSFEIQSPLLRKKKKKADEKAGDKLLKKGKQLANDQNELGSKKSSRVNVFDRGDAQHGTSSTRKRRRRR